MSSVDRSKHLKCENLAALLAHLQRLFAGTTERIVLVFDGIDKQRDAPPTFEAGLIRITEYVILSIETFCKCFRPNIQAQVPNLTIVYIATTIASLALHTTPPPSIHFPAYTRKQALAILIRDPPDLLLRDDAATTEDNLELWTNFCSAVWDSQANPLARDVLSFREAADTLWPPFIQPIRNGKIGVRAFSRLMVAGRGLFQSEDVLLQKLIPVQSEQGDRVVSRCEQIFTTSLYS